MRSHLTALISTQCYPPFQACPSNSLFPSKTSTKITYAFHILPSCNSLNSPCTPLFFGPDIFLRASFSNTMFFPQSKWSRELNLINNGIRHIEYPLLNQFSTFPSSVVLKHPTRRQNVTLRDISMLLLWWTFNLHCKTVRIRETEGKIVLEGTYWLTTRRIDKIPAQFVTLDLHSP
jgi:hypothetical protein